MSASSNNSGIILFNKKLMGFVEDLLLLCPNMAEFVLFKTTLSITASMTPKLPQQVFHSTVTEKYSECITNKSEDVLLNESYTDITDDLNIIDKIKHIWKTLTDENKNAIWQHLQVLLVLSNRVQNA